MSTGIGMSSTTEPPSLRPMPSDTGWRPGQGEPWLAGLGLSGLVHGVLLALALASLYLVQEDTAPLQAELWSDVPQTGGQAAPTPPPAPAETPPAPQAPAEPTPTPTPAEVVQTPAVTADIVEPSPQRHRKHRHRHDVPVETFDLTPPKPVAKATVPLKPAPAPKAQADSRAAAAQREALRQAHLEAMMRDLNAGSGGNGSGSAGAPAPLGATTSLSAGNSNAYGARLRAVVRPNIELTEAVDGNPKASVEVHCAPDGRIIARRIVQSSGSPRWDNAVLNALDATRVLPPNDQGRVPPVITMDFRPLDP